MHSEQNRERRKEEEDCKKSSLYFDNYVLFYPLYYYNVPLFLLQLLYFTF